jgi:hypothetical protein
MLYLPLVGKLSQGKSRLVELGLAWESGPMPAYFALAAWPSHAAGWGTPACTRPWETWGMSPEKTASQSELMGQVHTAQAQPAATSTAQSRITWPFNYDAKIGQILPLIRATKKDPAPSIGHWILGEPGQGNERVVRKNLNLGLRGAHIRDRSGVPSDSYHCMPLVSGPGQPRVDARDHAP